MMTMMPMGLKGPPNSRAEAPRTKAPAPAPALSKAKVEDFVEGLRRMCPHCSPDDLVRMAGRIKQTNDAHAPSPERSESPTPKRPYGPVNVEWLTYQPPTPGQKVRSFLLSVVPYILGLRSFKATIAARREQCGGEDACEFLHHGRTRRGLFCAACGCPESDLAAMAAKIQMPFAACPKDRWPAPASEIVVALVTATIGVSLCLWWLI